MSDSLIKVCHVEHQYDAESVVAALTKEDIASAYRQTPSVGLLAMPGAMGIDDMGFDVMVARDDRLRAREVLIGMGILGEEAAEQDAQEQEEAEKNGEIAEDDPQRRLEEELEEMGPVRAAFAKLGAIFLLLLLIAFCTWGVDSLIALFKAMLQK